MNKIYISDGATYYASWLKGFRVTHNRDEAAFMMFTGGVDVDPSLYGEKRGYYTNQPDSRREAVDGDNWGYALNKGLPMIGVCRGSQFLCVKNGGKLVQHSAHDYRHIIKTSCGLTLPTNSTHHQQAQITGVDPKKYELLAWAENLSPFHLNGDNNEYGFGKDYKEPEIIYWKETNSIGFQMHPESMDADSESVIYFQSLLNKL